MIIKSLSRKRNVDQLIRYILTDEKLVPVKEPLKRSMYVPGVKLTKLDIKHLESERVDALLLAEFKAFKGTMKEFIDHYISKAEKQNKIEPIIIKNNIRSRSINGYIREFEANEKFRLHARKDSVKAFHTILSFSQLDSKHLNEKILKDIAQHYISLRAAQSLVVGAVHRDKDHTHIHLIESGVQYCTGVSNRISRQQFRELKVAMQQYQKEKYPQMTHSIPEHGKSQRGKSKESASEKNKNPNAFEKQALLRCLDEVYATATSQEHFLAQLQSLGHVPYYRNGKFQGVRFNDERKYRIYRLGYDENRLLALDLRKAEAEKQLKELQDLRKGGRTISRNRSNDIDGINRALLYQETTDPKLQDKKRELQQELVNAGKEFENKNAGISETDSLNKAKPELANGHAMGQKEIPTERDNKENALQELQSLRENADMDIDRGQEDDLTSGESSNEEDMAEDSSHATDADDHSVLDDPNNNTNDAQ